MPTWWRLPGDDGGQINRREVEDGGTGLSRVKEVCQKFQILEDRTVAHVLQEQEVEEHLAANKQKAEQVRVNLRVARKLQEEEDEQSRRLARKLRRQLMDMENDYKQMLEEELQWQEETKQRSHTERKSRARGFSGEVGRRSEENEEEPVMERRAGASLWHGIRNSQPRSRRPFVVAEIEEGAVWCEEGSRREGDCSQLNCGSDMERERAAVGSGLPQVNRQAAAERQRHRSPARHSDHVKLGQKVGDSPEDGDPPASTQDQPKRHRTRPCVTEGSQQPARGDRREARKLDPPAAGGGSHRHLEGTVGSSTAAPISGYLAASPPAGLPDRKEHDAFRGSASDSESYPRRRRRGRDPEDVRARAMSEVSHRPVRARHGNKHRSPGPHLPMAETPPAPRKQQGIEGRAVNSHSPLESKEKLGQDGRWKVERGRNPLASGGQGNEIHQLLADKEKEVHHPLAASQKHVHHPLAADQKHVHHPLTANQKHIHWPLAANQKHIHWPLAADQKHIHHPLAANQKHIHHPLAADQKHVHHPLAVDQRHVHRPLLVGEDQAHHPLARNQKQARYPQATNQNHALHPLTVDKHVCNPPRTKAKGKQVHFQLAPSDRVSPNQTRLTHKEKQIQLPLDSKGKEVRSSLVGKQRHVRFPLAVGEKEAAVRGPLLVKENGVPCPLASNGKEHPGPSPLAVKRNPIQYRLESKDTEAIIDYVLDKRKGRASSSPKHAVRSPPAHWENMSGQSRGSPAEAAPDKARLLVPKPPADAQEKLLQPASWRTEKDPTRNPSSRCPDVMSDSVDSSGWSDETTNRLKDRTEAPSCPRGGHHRPRSRDTQSRGQAVRRRSGHSRSHSPSDRQHQVPTETGRDLASSKGSDPRNGLPASLWCSDETLKALQALELRRAQLRKATADEKQLQLARDEEFALDLLRQEVMAVSFSDKQKQSDLTQNDKDFPGRRNKKPPRSDSPSSENVDWAEKSKSAFF
ncbi:uncharacterized protein LOC127586552 isoform X2 [Pristis pectinata]|uniref:uncharacterized protein LOC127586552 isoform X2 n=1 Tax=Pristis pectinata TaxID=685728 RepID=UPI00223DB3D2|nr:uncharacterized protein LOC127586552 isoform X2 [Pristis pectinata]